MKKMTFLLANVLVVGRGCGPKVLTLLATSRIPVLTMAFVSAAICILLLARLRATVRLFSMQDSWQALVRVVSFLIRLCLCMVGNFVILKTSPLGHTVETRLLTLGSALYMTASKFWNLVQHVVHRFIGLVLTTSTLVSRPTCLLTRVCNLRTVGVAWEWAYWL